MPPTDQLRLRRGSADDVEALTRIYLDTRAAAVPAMPPQIHTPEEVRDYKVRILERDEVWVAEAPEVIGYAVLTETWLDQLYVAPGRQRRGIGSSLLDLAKSRRPDGFALWVFASNAPARAFYARHGLVDLESTDGSTNEERSPDVRMAWLGDEPLRYLRREIDAVDHDLSDVLSRRAALTAAVQDLKEVGGHAGRDPEREREIADRMAAHAPGLSAESVRRILHVVIEESLTTWEQSR